MIVDDEPFVRQGLISLIDWEEYDFEVCGEADNGADALKNAKLQLPDLIITDIRMPEMGGLDLIKLCQEEMKKDCKYIILSGYSEFEYARKAMNYGVVNYILKPIDEDELKESLINIKKELDAKQQKLSSFLDYKLLAASILKKYMNGQADKDKLNRIRNIIPNFDNGEFYYALLQPSMEEAVGNEYNLIQDMKKVICHEFGSSKYMYLVDEEKVQGILFTEELYQEYKNPLELSESIIDKLKESLKNEFILYLGEKSQGIIKIYESRESCLKAVNNNFICCKKGVVAYEEMSSQAFSFDTPHEILLDALLESVEKGNIEKINEDVESIYKEIVEKAIAPEIAKSNIISFELEVLNSIVNMKGDPAFIANNVEKLQSKFVLVKDLKNSLLKFSVEASNYIANLKQSKKGVLVEVKKYIESNFNKDLRLKNLSEHFYINPIYLGQIFKKSFGISFNDYLNNIRIEKAKELLLNTNEKICEIAEKVGYKDTNYFISRFEKMTHTTPTEYKKLCKKDR